MAWVVKHVLGIPYRLVGAENIPAGAGHRDVQAHVGLGDHHAAGHLPADGFRDEEGDPQAALLRLGIAQMPMIAIDRAAGKDALAQVVEQGIDRLGHGFWVTIFPEGTRGPGQPQALQAGGAVLAVSGARRWCRWPTTPASSGRATPSSSGRARWW